MAKEYNILFGPEGDARINFFIYTVESLMKLRIQGIPNGATNMPVYPKYETDPKKCVFEEDSFKVTGKFRVPDFFKPYFFTKDSVARGNDIYEKIHPEWVQLLVDIILYVYSDVNNDLKIAAMKKLKGSNNIKNKDETQIIKNLIRVFYKLEDNAGNSDVFESDDADWSSLSKISLNPDVLQLLFSSAVRPSTSNIITGTDKNVYELDQLASDFINLGNIVKSQLTKYSSPSGETQITYKYSEYVSKLYKSPLVDDESIPLSEEFWGSVSSKAQKYLRDYEGKLYRINDNGKKEQLDTLSFPEGKICSTIGATGKEESCGQYITKCLRGTDLKKCKEYLTNSESGFKMVEELKEINDMNPLALREYVTALKIGTKRFSDSNMTYDVLVTAEEWLSSLKTNEDFTEDDIKNIRKNSNIMKFIRLLSSLSRTEPALLNDDYTKNGTHSDEVSYDIFKGSILYSYGLPPNVRSGYPLATIHLTERSVEELHSLLSSEKELLRSRFGLKLRVTHMIGGGNGITNIKDLYEDSDIKLSYPIFEQYLAQLNKLLEHKGKKIASKDYNKIHENFRNLKESEISLKKAIKYINEYVRLLDSFGEKDTTEYLSIKHLKDFVERRNSKIERVLDKRTNMTHILDSIVKATNEMQ